MRPKPELLTRELKGSMNWPSILAAGLMRLGDDSVSAKHGVEKAVLPHAAGLEFPARSRLTVTPTCESSKRQK